MALVSVPLMWRRCPPMTVRAFGEHDLRWWVRAGSIVPVASGAHGGTESERRVWSRRTPPSRLRTWWRRTVQHRRRSRLEAQRRREQRALLRALHPCLDMSSGSRPFRPLPNNNCVAQRTTDGVA